MEKRRFLLIIPLLLQALSPVQAQWDASFSQPWAVRSYLNPSFAGEKEAIRTAALYRYPWSKIENAPRQFVVTADMPFEFFGRRHGAGLVAYTETTGTLRNSLLAAQYSFKKEIGSGFLNIGLQAGMHELNFDAGSRNLMGDTLIRAQRAFEVTEVKKKLFDLNVGISWTGQHAFVGLSVLHALQPRFPVYNDTINLTSLPADSLTTHVPRAYNLMAGCNIRLFHPLELQPAARVQSIAGVTRVQTALRLVYDRKFSGGASWKMDEGYAFFAGATLHGMELGYAYELYTGEIGKHSGGGHEVYLRYNLPVDSFKPKRQPHKSIRLL